MADQTNTFTKNPKNKLLSVILGILGLVLVLLIIGVGALLAGHVWNPKWNPFKQAPNTDKMIRDKIIKEIKK